MSLTLLFILLSLSFLFLLFKLKKTAASCLALSLVWIFLSGTGLLAKVLLDQLQTYPQLINPAWKSQNLIVLLGSGNYPWPQDGHFSTHGPGIVRVMEAARLYHSCRSSAASCKILASGGDLRNKGASEAKVMKSELVGIGVAAEDIILEDKSTNTFHNAKFSKALIEREQADLQLLVTSGFHQKRSLLYFSFFGMHPEAAPADYLAAKLTLIPNTRSMYLLDTALHEFLGQAQFYFYNFMGWNG